MPQELSHDGSLEERIIKDDFLLFLGEVSEIRCEPKFVIRGLYFGPSHYMGMWSEDRGKIRHGKVRGLVLGRWIDCSPK